ncbi:ribonuclease R [Candidatus Legionella polyplacis]|uniref:exoribonuclease II n=1 Tax=Candidatus Legionella polyplacis TaxID=2005262 RepID=A0ABZ2GZX9_9GAMM
MNHKTIKNCSLKIGKFFIKKNIGYVIPYNKSLKNIIFIHKKFYLGAISGQIVLVSTTFSTKKYKTNGKIIKILGNNITTEIKTKEIILSNNIPYKWTKKILNETKKISQYIKKSEFKKRKDLRTIPFITIDNENAKDLDDAVYCKQTSKKNYQLYVAIADVSHYIPINSLIDKEAARRGNSIYFPNRVIPMLPEKLSNNICSLLPNKDRLCIIIKINIHKNGKINNTYFYKGIFRSYAQLTYNQVNQWINKKNIDNKHKKNWTIIKKLYQLKQILLKNRKSRGALKLNNTDISLKLNKEKKIKKIISIKKNDAHEIVEECMLIVNTEIAKLLKKYKIPSIYRTHENPDKKKIKKLFLFLNAIGFKTKNNESIQSKNIQKIINKIYQNPKYYFLESTIIKSMKRAKYSEKNFGHFGLAYKEYTHFTSPIRRYSDLLMHRAISHIIKYKSPKNFYYSQKDIKELSKHCSFTEQRSDKVTKNLILWLKCNFLQKKIGKQIQGTIISITRFNIIVDLKKWHSKGIIYIKTLKDDYYIFNNAKYNLIGKKNKNTYNLGDNINVSITKINVNKKKIILKLINKL